MFIIAKICGENDRRVTLWRSWMLTEMCYKQDC